MAKFTVLLYIFLSTTSLIFLMFYVLGAVRYLTALEPNTCDMTFMFEYPEYVEIKLDPDAEKKFPKFGLYIYGEGYMIDKHHRMKFSGIPALFIPGNAGSHEQVRSIASVSLRMSLKRRTPFHFDFFTVSLAKGLSALYGGVLEEQTQFVQHCIKHILTLYNNTNNVNQVLLIAHSMGGLVAKAALLRDITTSNTSLANILIMLSTPHTPRAAFDKTFADFYHQVHTQAHFLKQTNTSIVSIGGGPRDLLVSSSQIVDPDAALNVLSTSIPNVWRSQDHLSILWCKQLTIVLVRSLFDCVDLNSGRRPKIVSDPDARLNALSYHLSSRYSGKYALTYQSKFNLESNPEIIEITTPFHTFQSTDNAIKKSKNKPMFLMIPLQTFKSYNRLSLDTIELQTSDWLFACSIPTSNKACKTGINLTNRTKLFPDHKYRVGKTVDLDLDDIRENIKATHLIIRVSADDMNKKIPVMIFIDIYSMRDRIVPISGQKSSFIPSQFSPVVNSFESTSITIEKPCLRYYFNVTGVHDALNVILQSVDSKEASNNQRGYVGIQVREPWYPKNSDLTQYYSMTEADVGKINTVRLQTAEGGSNAMNFVEIRVSVDPRFSYKLVIRRAGFVDRLANFVRDRWFRLYPTTIGLLLLAIATRMDNSRFNVPMTIGITCFGSLVFGLMIEVFVASGLLIVLAVGTCCAVIFSGSMVHNLTARFLAKALAHFPIVWYDWLLRQTLDNLPFFTSFIIVILVSSSCAAIVMLLSVIFYFLKLTRMYEDYLEELFMASLRTFARKLRKPSSSSSSSSSSTSSDKPKTEKEQNEQKEGDADNDKDVNPTTNIINHLLLFMTWYLTAASAIPTALVWAKNFSYETRLSTEDKIMFISWIVLTGWASLGFVKITPPTDQDNNNNRLQIIAVFQRLLGWSLLVIAMMKNPAEYQWIIPPVVAMFITRIVLSKLFVKPLNNCVNQSR